MAFLIREISYPCFLAGNAMGGHVAKIYVLFSIPAYTAVKLLLVTVTHFSPFLWKFRGVNGTQVLLRSILYSLEKKKGK